MDITHKLDLYVNANNLLGHRYNICEYLLCLADGQEKLLRDTLTKCLGGVFLLYRYSPSVLDLETLVSDLGLTEEPVSTQV